jgi:hypothetical protein
MAFEWETIEISPKALEDAASVGLQGDLQTKVRNLLRFSVPFSHPQGNRRFKEVMLLVKDNVLQSIAPIAEDPKKIALDEKNWRKYQAKHPGAQRIVK